MKAIRSHTRVRAGYTMVELLIVIGLIAILMALTVAATIRFIASQQVSNTSNELSKLQSGLNKRVVAVMEAAKAVGIAPAGATLAGGRARA